MFLNGTMAELTEIATHFVFNENESEDVQFFYFEKNLDKYRKLTTNSTKDMFQNDLSPIKFVIHGWGSTGDYISIRKMAEAYHFLGINNVIGVDWSAHAKQLSYVAVIRDLKRVAKSIAKFIAIISENRTEMLKRIHLIGHSLGAHIAGVTGKYIFNSTGVKLDRITALDAAGPLFEMPQLESNARLIKTDADFVDAIHTNRGLLGYASSFALVDYYPNFGGPIQPSCLNKLLDIVFCSHNSAFDIYIKSIKNNIEGYKCQNPLMFVAQGCRFSAKFLVGERVTRKTRGDFYSTVYF